MPCDECLLSSRVLAFTIDNQAKASSALPALPCRRCVSERTVVPIGFDLVFRGVVPSPQMGRHPQVTRVGGRLTSLAPSRSPK